MFPIMREYKLDIDKESFVKEMYNLFGVGIEYKKGIVKIMLSDRQVGEFERFIK